MKIADDKDEREDADGGDAADGAIEVKLRSCFLFLHFLYLLKIFSVLLETFLFVFELDLFFLKHFGAKVQ